MCFKVALAAESSRAATWSGTRRCTFPLLEPPLGVRLFNRGRGGLSLTDAGQALLPRAERALLELKLGQDEMGDFASLQRGHILLAPHLAFG